jgi:hypothetical protein
MSSISINQNTLLKLVIRSGTDSDRQAITLDVGELGYTTDHKRLYVGDGITPGGSLVSNIFNGSRSSITSSPGNPKTGDYAFDTSTQTLYRHISGNGSNLSDWQVIGGVYTPEDTTIVSTNNQLKVGTLSANNISADALGNSLTLSTGRIALSSTIDVARIITPYLQLPKEIIFNELQYEFPDTIVDNGFLQTDSSGILQWNPISSILQSASAILTTGPGLSVFVNGNSTTATSLLTSQNVEIRGSHIPACHATFTQGSVITKSALIVSVAPLTLSQLKAYPQYADVNGVPLSASQSQYDSKVNGATGAYLITLSKPFNIAGAEVEVFAKNASYRFDPSQTTICNSSLDSGYFIVPDVTTFDKVVVFFYTSTIFNTSGVFYTGNGLLTPGYNSNRTRFCINVYGTPQ